MSLGGDPWNGMIRAGGVLRQRAALHACDTRGPYDHRV